MARLFLPALFAIATMIVACSRGGCATTGSGTAGQGYHVRRVVDGTPDTYARDNAIVLLVSFHSGQSYADTCTGTFIAPNLLLTAAHCIPGVADVKTDARTYAFLGTDFTVYSSQQPNLNDGNWVPVKGFAHDSPLPDYKGLENGTSNGDPPAHDVAIAQLASPVDVQPLPIAYGAVTNIGQRIRVVGYGASTGTESESDGGGIKRTGLGTVLQIYAAGDLTTVLDVGVKMTSDRSACRGDSGAPGLLSTTSKDYVIGVVSGGPPDCTHGYFESVDASRTFIESVMQRSAAALQSGTCTP